MTFGKYPDVSLAMVGDQHREARTTLATGVDPMALEHKDKNSSGYLEFNA
jgi:hypothetical protein